MRRPVPDPTGNAAVGRADRARRHAVPATATQLHTRLRHAVQADDGHAARLLIHHLARTAG